MNINKQEEIKTLLQNKEKYEALEVLLKVTYISKKKQNLRERLPVTLKLKDSIKAIVVGEKSGVLEEFPNISENLLSVINKEGVRAFKKLLRQYDPKTVIINLKDKEAQKKVIAIVRMKRMLREIITENTILDSAFIQKIKNTIQLRLVENKILLGLIGGNHSTYEDILENLAIIKNAIKEKLPDLQLNKIYIKTTKGTRCQIY